MHEVHNIKGLGVGLHVNNPELDSIASSNLAKNTPRTEAFQVSTKAPADPITVVASPKIAPNTVKLLRSIPKTSLRKLRNPMLQLSKTVN